MRGTLCNDAVPEIGMIDRLRDKLVPAYQAPPEFDISRWLFLRLLGVVYLAAFVSLWVQIDGLIGSGGILPIGEFLHGARESSGDPAWLRAPTLCWLDPGDAMLHALCASGTISSSLLILGILPMPMLVLLWTCYLSLAVAGQVFLDYQWDALLLETGLLAIFFTPLGWLPLPGRPAAPTILIRWLLRWLLFRLMFAAGLVKLVSGDASWHDLSALHVHYQTQPLPSWVSWYLHQAPGWFQSTSVLLTFAAELGLPILLFGPPRWRHAGCLGIAGFQLLIGATGNFGFFNLLTIALCVAQLDDGVFPAALRRWLAPSHLSPDPAGECRAWRALVYCFAGLVLLLSLVPFLSNLGLDRYWPGWFREAHRTAAAFRSVNQYGMFAVMTTSRREIMVEGSADGKTWLAYEFRYKPGDVNRAPAIVPLHLPRLDWQMWFAALETNELTPWFKNFVARLQSGAPEVLALLEGNPFPDRPPPFLRAVMFEYRFTSPDERRTTGAWWRREYLGSYRPLPK